jgi:hypothetical protein
LVLFWKRTKRTASFKYHFSFYLTDCITSFASKNPDHGSRADFSSKIMDSPVDALKNEPKNVSLDVTNRVVCSFLKKNQKTSVLRGCDKIAVYDSPPNVATTFSMLLTQISQQKTVEWTQVTMSLCTRFNLLRLPVVNHLLNRGNFKTVRRNSQKAIL